MLPPFRRQEPGAPQRTIEAPAIQTSVGNAAVSPEAAAAPIVNIRDQLQQMVTRNQQAQDFQAEEDARRAGYAAGAENPGVTMQDGGLIYRTQFNRSAAEAGTRQLEINARDRLDELAQQFRTDPQGFSNAVTAYRSGIMQGLPPEIGARFGQAIDVLARPQFNQIRQASIQATGEASLARFAEAMPRRVASIERLSVQAATDPDARRAVDAEIENFRQEVASLGPREAFEFAGRQYPADPTRAGLPLPRLVPQLQAVEQAMTRAGIYGAWAASGYSEEWINQFEASQFGLPGARPPAGAAGATGGREASGRPGERNDAEVARLQAELRAAATDPNRQGELDGLRRQLVVASGQPLNNPARAGVMEGRDPALNHWDRDLPPPTGTIPASGTPAAQPAATRQPGQTMAGLPAEETRGIVAWLRQQRARMDADEREGLEERRADFHRRLRENEEAISRGFEAPNRWTDAEARSLRLDPAALRRRETSGAQIYTARQTAQTATTPEQLTALAREYQPGTAAFRGAPAEAGRLLDYLRERGAAIETGTLTARIADLTAVAQTTGRVTEITAEEARRAQVPVERVTEVNARIRQEGALYRSRQEALALPPAEREAALARLAVEGEDAAENAGRIRIMREAFRERDEAVQRDPAGFALGQSGTARQLLAQVQQGVPGALPNLVQSLAEEQARLNIPAAQRRALPAALEGSLVGSVATATDANAGVAALQTLVSAVPPAQLLPALQRQMTSGPQIDDRRQAVAVAASVLPSNPGLAREIMAGAIVLRDTPVPGLTSQRLAPDADAILRDAFAGQPGARDAAIAAAKALYAARGSSGGNLGVAYDGARFREALEQVAPTTRLGGRSVPVPLTMTPAQFDARLENIRDADLDGAVAQDGRPITAQRLRLGTMQLIPVGSGAYSLRINNFDVLQRGADRRPSNRVFVLNVNNLPEARERPVEPDDGVGLGSEALGTEALREAPMPSLPRITGPDLSITNDPFPNSGRITNRPVGEAIFGRRGQP